MLSPVIVLNLVYSIADKSLEGSVFEYINTLAFEQSQYSLATAMSMLYLLIIGIIIAVVFALVNKVVVKPE